MTELPYGDGAEFIQELITPEGKIIREVVFGNPYTGEVYRIIEIHETRYDQASGAPVVHDEYLLPTGIDGCVLDDLNEFSICAEGGEPVSRIHSVVDPFCGRILCLMHSQLVDVDGMQLRVCAMCAKAIKRQKLKKAIIGFFFGKKK